MLKKCLLIGMISWVGMPLLKGQSVTLDLNKQEPVDERVSPVVRERIEQYALKVREIVIKEKVAMAEELGVVDKDVALGKNTLIEAENKKAEIALRFSEQINSGIKNLSFDLDEITKQQVQYTIMNTDLEELKKENKKEVMRPLNQMVGYLSYGMISLPDDDHAVLNDHLGYNSGIDFGLLYHRQLSVTSPFSFVSGLYLSWRTLRFEDDYFLTRSKDGVVQMEQFSQNLEKSKLRATYLMVPLGLKYNFSKLKTGGETPYRNISKGWGIGLNIYGGLKLSSNHIVKGDGVNYRDKDTNYDLTHFAYGGQLTMSFQNWNFFVRQEFSPVFEKPTLDDRRMLQFGINVGF